MKNVIKISDEPNLHKLAMETFRSSAEKCARPLIFVTVHAMVECSLKEICQ